MAASIPIAAVTIVRGAGRKLRHLNGHGVSAPILQRYFTRTLSTKDLVSSDHTDKKIQRRSEKISAAMKAFLKKAREHEIKVNIHTEEYELGRKHLANMMGIHPDEMTKDHINEAIQYLLPSGLFDKGSRPQFKHPKDFLPVNLEFPFDVSGRPHHYQYYTMKPYYYQMMSEAAWRTESLKEEEIRIGLTGQAPKESMTHLTEEFDWMDTKTLIHTFKSTYSETVTEKDHKRFVEVMTKLSKMRLREQDVEFLRQYGSQKSLETKSADSGDDRKFLTDETGRNYKTVNGFRKTAKARVTVYGEGKGSIEINGRGLDYFNNEYAREQILFPLLLTETLDGVDVRVTVEGGGEMGQSGAIRHGLSKALLPFVSQQMCNKLSLAGLLDRDSRIKERKKPGQKKARKQFQW
ncbi:28S ribosomal protein S9, mitochondrial-like isoform X2 [Ostrea edulis]|nr:28S ribosomal protein S9, mitochondrial-like isoform X2 [Ostrea edulis]